MISLVNNVKIHEEKFIRIFGKHNNSLCGLNILLYYEKGPDSEAQSQ